MIQVVETEGSRIKELISLVRTTDRRLRNIRARIGDPLKNNLDFEIFQGGFTIFGLEVEAGHESIAVFRISGPYDASKAIEDRIARLSLDKEWTDISITVLHDEYRELAKRIAAKYADLTGKNVTIILE